MRYGRAVVLWIAVCALATPLIAQQASDPDLRLFFEAASPDKNTSEKALKEIGKHWKNGYAAMLLEWVRFLPSGKAIQGDLLQGGGGMQMYQGENTGGGGGGGGGGGRGGGGGGGGGPDPFRSDSTRFKGRHDPRIKTRTRIIKFVQEKTGQKHGGDLKAWRKWLWSQPYDSHPQYGVFKANAYGSIDPRFRNFFNPEGTNAIRLDEVLWGGVKVGGIPALDHPKTLTAGEAGYLADSDIVFGIYAGGQARAYPKRILAWHELAWDQLGGNELTIVYCTLCGTVIPYKSDIGGRIVKFDTSGLLYQSNKLLYDDLTWTLWSSLTGEPVAGRMVGRGVRLVALPAVTTTWGEWRETHPDTTVLSLDTGFKRDYAEGVAYASYFATDELMFDVSETSNRLPNKEEVLAIRFPRPGGGDEALAIAAPYLQANRLFQTEFAGRELLVVTSPAGANRVYAASGLKFVELVGDNQVRDSQGKLWTAGEDSLIPVDDPQQAMPRLTAFRAFWFGWYAQYPDTELIS